jgi:hypothetical protein
VSRLTLLQQARDASRTSVPDAYIGLRSRAADQEPRATGDIAPHEILLRLRQRRSVVGEFPPDYCPDLGDRFAIRADQAGHRNR